MRVIVLGPNLRIPGEDFHAHKADCLDVKRNPVYRQARGDAFELAGVRDIKTVVEMVYDPDDFEYDEGEWRDFAHSIKFFPCIDLPDETEPISLD